MSKHICKNCQKQFDYCRACIFKPIYYHEVGYCSEKCLTEDRLAEKNKSALQAEKTIGVTEPQNEIPTIDKVIVKEDTSSFGTEECVSDEDIETAPIE